MPRPSTGVMLLLKKILVPTDLKEPGAILRALSLAHPYQAEVFVLHLTNNASSSPEWDEETFCRWLGTEAGVCSVPLDALMENLRFECLPLGERTPTEVTLEFAGRYRFDLIVMGTHARKGIDRLLGGSITEEIVRRAPCPVLTYHLDEPPTLSPCVPRHVLVPTDLSDCSQHALMHAKEIAGRFGARITLLHVVHHRTLLPSLDDPVYRRLLEEMMQPGFFDEHLRALDEGVPGPHVETSYRIVHGNVAERIVTFAENEAVDLIVLATHGLTGIRHFLMGSVAEKVVRMAKTPVFTVKSFGRSLVTSTPASFKQPETTSIFHMLRHPLEELPEERPIVAGVQSVEIPLASFTPPVLSSHPLPVESTTTTVEKPAHPRKEPPVNRPPVSHAG